MKWIDTRNGLYALDKITFLRFKEFDCKCNGIELETEDKYGKSYSLISFSMGDIIEYAEANDITLDFSDEDTEKTFINHVIGSMEDNLIDFLEDESKVFDIVRSLIESIEEEAKYMIS